MENFWEYAAATFVVALLLRFIWGRITENWEVPEFTTEAELLTVVVVAVPFNFVGGFNSGDYFLTVATSVMAINVWTLVALTRTALLVKMMYR